jgi:hypothetical protein
VCEKHIGEKIQWRGRKQVPFARTAHFSTETQSKLDVASGSSKIFSVAQEGMTLPDQTERLPTEEREKHRERPVVAPGFFLDVILGFDPAGFVLKERIVASQNMVSQLVVDQETFASRLIRKNDGWQDNCALFFRLFVGIEQCLEGLHRRRAMDRHLPVGTQFVSLHSGVVVVDAPELMHGTARDRRRAFDPRAIAGRGSRHCFPPDAVKQASVSLSM